jgi:hypothetical protein
MYQQFSISDRIKPKTFDLAKHQGIKWAHQKRNGHRVTVFRPDDHSKTLVIPRKEELNYWDQLVANQPHIAYLIQKLPPFTILDAELEARNRRASNVITGLIDPAVVLDLAPFAAPVWDNQDWRDQPLPEVMSMVESHGFVPPTLLDVRGFLAIRNIETMLLDWAIRDKHEGWVVKDAHYSGWYKIKPQKTIDAVVIRSTVSDSLTKYGDLKAIIVGVYNDAGKLVEIANVGAGFSDEERAFLVKQDLTGWVCEVMYQDVLEKGRLQFPRFMRWRPDKVATECVISQDSDLIP